MPYTLAGKDTSPPALVVPPGALQGDKPASTTGVNSRLHVFRFQLATATTLRYFCFEIATAAGNIEVGVLKLNGLNWTAKPMSSGVVASPAAGNVRYDLGATELAAGEYGAFFWCDDTTFALRYSTGGNSSIRAVYELGSPTSPIPSTGTVTGPTTRWFPLSVEGDV